MRHFLSFLVSFFYVLNVVAAPAWFPEGIQTKGSSTIGEKSTANSSAVLDVRSTTKGMLPPRMTTAQRTAIASPATGLLVYDTDTLTVWQYNGTGWVEVGSGGAGGAQYNVIENYDFEATTYSDGWTASAGVLAAATGTNILFGDQSATWDASAASQTLSYTSQAIGQGYKANNCEGAIFVQTPSGTASHTLQVYDGTNVLASVSITSYTTPKEFSTGAFPCPSSGNWQLRIVSNADEPLIAVDNAYLGLFRGVGTADVHTEWRSFTPSVLNLGTGGLSENSGMWRRIGDSMHVRIRVRKDGSGGSGATAVVFENPTAAGCTIDTSKLPQTTFQQVGVALDASYGMTGSVVYLSGGVYLYSMTETSGQFNGANFAANKYIALNYSLPCVGWAATQTVMPDVQGLSWSGTHGNDCIWTTTSTSLAAIGTGDASCTFTQLSNRNFGSVTSATASSNNIPGIVFTPRVSGRYFICVNAHAYNASAVGNYAGLAIHDGTSIIASSSQRNGRASTGTNDEMPHAMCGIATLSAGASRTVQLYANASAGTTTLAAGAAGVANVTWSIFNVDQPVQAILANSVSTFNQNGSYTFGAGVTAADCTSTPCTLYDGSTPGVTITRASTGVYSLNYAGLGITKTPTCAISHNRGSGDYKCDGGTATTTSQTIFCYQNTTGSTWVAVDSRPSAVCLVNR